MLCLLFRGPRGLCIENSLQEQKAGDQRGGDICQDRDRVTWVAGEVMDALRLQVEQERKAAGSVGRSEWVREKETG